jgi:hypothetical protein
VLLLDLNFAVFFRVVLGSLFSVSVFPSARRFDFLSVAETFSITH